MERAFTSVPRVVVAPRHPAIRLLRDEPIRGVAATTRLYTRADAIPRAADTCTKQVDDFSTHLRRGNCTRMPGLDTPRSLGTPGIRVYVLTNSKPRSLLSPFGLSFLCHWNSTWLKGKLADECCSETAGDDF